MPYFPNYRKPVDRLPPDPPPSAATSRRRGRKPTPIPPAALDHIRTLREAGVGFEAIRAALSDEFGLTIGLATLHAIWERELEPATDDGRFIARMQRQHGLSAKFWRRYLDRDRQRQAESAASSAEDSQSSPIHNQSQSREDQL